MTIRGVIMTMLIIATRRVFIPTRVVFINARGVDLGDGHQVVSLDPGLVPQEEDGDVEAAEARETSCNNACYSSRFAHYYLLGIYCRRHRLTVGQPQPGYVERYFRILVQMLVCIRFVAFRRGIRQILAWL